MVKEALEHVQANWNIVSNGDELLELPLPQLITLLSSEQLKVDSEAQVWYHASSVIKYHSYLISDIMKWPAYFQC